MNRRVLFWLAVVVAALGLGVGASAAGSQPEPSIKVDPDEARPGETVTVIGECFGGCGETPLAKEVTLTLLDGEAEVPDFEQVVTELKTDGSFEEVVELPDDLAKGRHKVRAEGSDGLSATDKLFVGQQDSSDGGNDGNGDNNGDNDGRDKDERDRASASPDDCQAPPLTSEPPAAAAETPDTGSEGQTSDSDEPRQADDCDDVAPAATAPGGQGVRGESQDSDGSDGTSSPQDSGNEDGDGSDDADEDNEDDDGGNGKRGGKNADGDSDEDDEDEDSGGAGGGKGNDRGQDGAAGGGSVAETVRAAAGPAPEDIRQAVPWAMIALLGVLFALGLGATYHVVGRWAPEPADVG